ncbi:CPCC family cysteine-rich protein [Parvibaculum sp. MBR-TMA-1.3b-4.2]|jgi:hypothetical protein
MDEKQARRWFERYTDSIEAGVIKPAIPGHLYRCPCCGYPTLEERGGYDICGLCNWEDDGQDDPHADEVWGGPNGGYSLTEARANFRRYLIMYDPSKPSKRVGGNNNTPAEHELKQAIVQAFDAMADEKDQDRIDALGLVVRENFRLLDKILSDRI